MILAMRIPYQTWQRWSVPLMGLALGAFNINLLKLLPSQQKAVLAMFYLDRMPVRLIAEALSLPEGTVKSRLYHARCHLREVLERRNP